MIWSHSAVWWTSALTTNGVKDGVIGFRWLDSAVCVVVISVREATALIDSPAASWSSVFIDAVGWFCHSLGVRWITLEDWDWVDSPPDWPWPASGKCTWSSVDRCWPAWCWCDRRRRRQRSSYTTNASLTLVAVRLRLKPLLQLRQNLKLKTMVYAATCNQSILHLQQNLKPKT